jgi:hypothetical protein
MLGLWLLMVHAAALLVLPLLPVAPWLLTALAAGVLLSLWWHWYIYVHRTHRYSVRGFHWGEARHCQLQLGTGQWITAQLAPQALILPWLVILHFDAGQSRRRHLVIAPDMLASDPFRRLRVRLKLELARPES